MTDWSQLRHAYGDATDVPAMLTRVADDDRAEHAEGLTDLLAAICHQGTAYSATLAAIPSLLAVLRRLPRGDRAPMLSGLGSIAQSRGDGVREAELHDALALDLPLLASLLRDGTSTERALTLAMLTGPAFAGLAPEVSALARDGDELPVVRARAWEALRVIAPGTLPVEVDDLPAVRLTAALARLAVEGAQAGPALLDRVAEGLSDRAAASLVEAWSRGSAAGPVWAPCAPHLAAHAPLRRALAQRLMDQTDMILATDTASVLLAALFAAGEAVDLASLSDAQREALVALAEADGAFLEPGQINGNLMNLLAAHGLPAGFDARDVIAEALDVRPASRVMVVTPREVRGARERCVALGRAAWLDVPFVLMREPPDFSAAIPEDPDDFPEAVMRDYVDIVHALQAMVQRHTMPANNGGFYPSLTVEAFIDVARAHGCEVVPPNLTYANAPYDPAQWTDEDPFFGPC